MHVFRPDAEAAGGAGGRGRESEGAASRVELVRGAESVTSERPLEANETPLRDASLGAPPPSEEPDFGNDGGGDLDFDAEAPAEGADGAPGAGAAASVDTARDGDASSAASDRRRSRHPDLEISGLDEASRAAGSAADADADAEASAQVSDGSEPAPTPPPPRRRRRSAGPRRMKKRRKIVIDNDRTELSSDHMKAMLRDTSDILRRDAHPAAWPRDDGAAAADGGDAAPHGGLGPALRGLPVDRLLARPCLADDAGLAPALLALWGRNAAKVEGKAGTPLPFRMRGAKGEEQRGAAAERILEEEAAAAAVPAEEEDVEGIEKARAQEAGGDAEGQEAMESDVEFGGGDQGPVFDEEEQQDEDMETPFDIQDFDAAENKDADPAMEEADDESSVRSERSSFSLGAVNDLEKELYGADAAEAEDGDDPRQTVGDELVSHTAKWHKHTVRVFGMLKRNIRSRNADELDEEEMAKPATLGYHKLSAGCSRRTAAGVFFEMLQLKTWDFVELNQDTSYGDITVAPGVRFDEPPPTA